MELVPDKLYFVTETEWRMSRKIFPARRINLDNVYRVKDGSHFVVPSIQSILLHCSEVERRLEQYESIVYTTNDGCDTKSIRSRTCSVLFMATYAVINLGWSTKYAMQRLTRHIQGSLGHFHDHHGSVKYGLSVEDCLEAINVGVKRFGWFKNKTTKVVNRGMEMNWIIPNKVIAMRDPSKLTNSSEGMVDSKLKAELKDRSINMIVRLNKLDRGQNSKRGVPYDPSEFTEDGFCHVDIPFKDCGIPTMDQVREFLELVSSPRAKVAVHCYAGLGRTGTMIACYLMYEYGFTSRQAVGWLNLCRRGSVMGKQHQFLDEIYENISSLKLEGLTAHARQTQGGTASEKEAVKAQERLLSSGHKGQKDERLITDYAESPKITDSHLKLLKFDKDENPKTGQDRTTKKRHANVDSNITDTTSSGSTISAGSRGQINMDLEKASEEDLDEEESYHTVERNRQTSLELFERDNGPCFMPTFEKPEEKQAFQRNILSKTQSNKSRNEGNENVIIDLVRDFGNEDIPEPKSDGDERNQRDGKFITEIEEKIMDISVNLERRISGLFELINPDLNSKYESKLNELLKMLS